MDPSISGTTADQIALQYEWRFSLQAPRARGCRQGHASTPNPTGRAPRVRTELAEVSPARTERGAIPSPTVSMAAGLDAHHGAVGPPSNIHAAVEASHARSWARMKASTKAPRDGRAEADEMKWVQPHGRSVTSSRGQGGR